MSHRKLFSPEQKFEAGMLIVASDYYLRNGTALDGDGVPRFPRLGLFAAIGASIRVVGGIEEIIKASSLERVEIPEDLERTDALVDTYGIIREDFRNNKTISERFRPFVFSNKLSFLAEASDHAFDPDFRQAHATGAVATVSELATPELVVV